MSLNVVRLTHLMFFDRLQYTDDLDAPRRARRFVEAVLGESGYTGDISLVVLLASELVTNSIQHGEPPFALTLEVVDGVATVSIEDHDSQNLPERRPPVADGPCSGGRGLMIVDELADEWGCDVRPDAGKAVWFRLGPG